MTIRDRIYIAKMSQEQARQWLIANDSEGAHIWRTLPDTTDFKACVRDNVRDYGSIND